MMKANDSLKSKRFDTFSVIFKCNKVHYVIVTFTASSILIIAFENDASKCVETKRDYSI